MRKKIPLVEILLTILVFSACNKCPMPSLEMPVRLDDALLIKEWQVIGPFGFDSLTTRADETFDIDDLKYLGIREDSLNICSFKSINIDNAKNKILKSDRFVNKRISTPTDFLEFSKILNLNNLKGISNVYVACNIHCKNDVNTYFMTNACHGYKIWLNNKLIIKKTGIMKTNRNYDLFTPVELKKGDNILLIKVNYQKTTWNKVYWHLFFRIGSAQAARKYYEDNYLSSFLCKALIDKSQQLSVYLGPYAQCHNNKYEIVGINERKIYSKNNNLKVDSCGYIKVELPELEDGLYKFRILAENQQIEQLFYKGDITNKYFEFEKRYKNIPLKEKETDSSFYTNLERFRYLLNKDYSHLTNDDIEWYNRSKVFWANEIDKVLIRLENGLESFRHAPGTFLRTYISGIDESKQVYMFHVSEQTLKNISIPLMIVLPYNFDFDIPMTQCYYVNNLLQRQWEAKIADESGMAILWTYMRGKSQDSYIAFNDIWESLESIRKDYNIDNNRIYLSGACAGGKRVVLLSARNPDLFAGVFVFTPILITDINKDFPLQNKNPINFIQNLKNVPVFMMFNKDDNGIPFTLYKKFIDGNASITTKPVINFFEGYSHEHEAKYILQEGFNYVKDKKRIIKPDTVSFVCYELKFNKAYWVKINTKPQSAISEITAYFKHTTNTFEIETKNVLQYEIILKESPYYPSKSVTVTTNGKISFQGQTTNNIKIDLSNEQVDQTFKNHETEGPVNHALASRFIITIGDAGNCVIDSLATDFILDWQAAYMSTCLNKLEKDITLNDIENSNIVLFGSSFTNPIIKKIIEGLPFQIYRDAIELNSQKYDGENLGLCFIYPNPLNKNKYVVVIATNSNKRIPLFVKRLSVYADHDYYIWNDNAIIDNGFFNEYWK